MSFRPRSRITSIAVLTSLVLSIAAPTSAQDEPLAVKDAIQSGQSSIQTSVTALPAGEVLSDIPARQSADASELTLTDAVNRALDSNPALMAAAIEKEALQGEASQAGAFLNPQLTYEADNFAGSTDYSGFDVAEQTVSVAQTIELGGKRRSRMHIANLDVSLADWNQAMLRQELKALASLAFRSVLLSQQRLSVLTEFVEIAQRTSDSVDARASGGKASPIEQDRAFAALARSEALLQGETRRLEAARVRLSGMWGAQQPDFSRAVGDMEPIASIPPLSKLSPLLEANPILARWSDEKTRRSAELSFEKSKVIPDLTVGAGIRRFSESDDNAFVATVAIPIPVLDQNRGNITAATKRLTKADNDREATLRSLLAELADAHGALSAAAAEYRTLAEHALPAAQRAFERTKIGFDEGKFDILHVLDAQRSVFETRMDALAIREDYEKNRIRIEALIGRDLNEKDL